MNIQNKVLFDRLIQEAWEHDFSGWDWNYLQGRMAESLLSWDYCKMVFDQSRNVHSMLDIGTGGGEFLATLQPFPPQVFATENYPPNFEIARKFLEPLGVKVIGLREEDPLPFEDNSLELVINRHASIMASDVHRILKPGCRFITQQVGGRNDIRFNEILQDKVEFIYSYWTLDHAVNELAQSGFEIIQALEEFPETSYYDIGAVVFHLKIISWQVEGFSIEKYYGKLALIHNMIQETGKFVVNSHRFLIEARK